MAKKIESAIIEEKAAPSASLLESANADLKAMQRALEEQKAFIRAQKAALKEKEKELKAAQKAAPRIGQFDILADLIRELGLQEEGFSRIELHKAYLEALGMDSSDPYSPEANKKMASIGAQLGSRIMPKMEARGIAAIESRGMIGKNGKSEKRYFCIPAKA